MVLFTQHYKRDKPKTIVFNSLVNHWSKAVKSDISLLYLMLNSTERTMLIISAIKIVNPTSIIMAIYCNYMAIALLHVCSKCRQKRTNLKTGCDKLDHLQRLACLSVIGALRITPTAAMEIIMGLVPVSVYIQQAALLTCHRLTVAGQLWSHCYQVFPGWQYSYLHDEKR